MTQTLFLNLAILNIEKHLLSKIDFDDIVDKFALTDRKILLQI